MLGCAGASRLVKRLCSSGRLEARGSMLDARCWKPSRTASISLAQPRMRAAESSSVCLTYNHPSGASPWPLPPSKTLSSGVIMRRLIRPLFSTQHTRRESAPLQIPWRASMGQRANLQPEQRNIATSNCLLFHFIIRSTLSALPSSPSSPSSFRFLHLLFDFLHSTLYPSRVHTTFMPAEA